MQTNSPLPRPGESWWFSYFLRGVDPIGRPPHPFEVQVLATDEYYSVVRFHSGQLERVLTSSLFLKVEPLPPPPPSLFSRLMSRFRKQQPK